MNYVIARVRSGMENKITTALEDRGYSPYVPQQTRWRKKGKDKVRADSPLFPGYLFVPHQDGFRYDAIRQIEGVTGFLTRTIPAEPIAEIQTREVRGDFDYARDRRAAQKAKKQAMRLTEFASLDREEVLSVLNI